MSLTEIKSTLHALANPEKVEIYKNFHKTKEDGYAKGEEFIGVTIPNIRKVALNNIDISYNEILKLLASNVHEEKYVAAEILSAKYKKTSNKKELFDFYIDNASKLTGWDLVDTTAPQIAGHFLYHFGKEYSVYKSLLSNLAKSSNLWERRIAIVSTYYFIKNNDFSETLKIAEILLNDKHDLIHKAVGWMLREVGKKDISILKGFLKKHYKIMPRTMLRYAIERFPEAKRKAYLKSKV